MTRPAFLVFVSVRMAAAAAALLALVSVLAACGDADEELAPDVTPAATATLTTVPPTALVTPSPSPPPIPADWPTYADPGGFFTVRYPPTWFQLGPSFYSADPGRFDPLRIELPPEVVKVEVSYYEAKRATDCGGLSVDPATGQGTPRDGARPTTLGGIEAWELVREAGDPAIEGNLTRIQGVAAIQGGYCLLAAAYFTQEKPDQATFLQIVASYRFLGEKQ